jgi:adenylate cyclase
MGREIERKFLLTADTWRGLATGSLFFCQGYLCSDKKSAVRVRIAQNTAFLTIKAAVSDLTRLEFEYPLPLEDAKSMLEQLADKPLVEKIRYTVPYCGLIWEVDEFLGANAGLTLAEVELSSEDQSIEKPAWIGREVTTDSRYYNVNLAKNPYRNWKETIPAIADDPAHT